MKMNLSQMQAIQQCLDNIEYTFKADSDIKPMKPVFKYNGHIISADFYYDMANESEPSVPFVKTLDLDSIDKRESSFVVNNKSVNGDKDLSIYKANRYMQYRQYKTIFKSPELTFSFLIHASNEFISKALPTKYLINVQCLDESLNSNIKFIGIDENSEFDFISLIPKN